MNKSKSLEEKKNKIYAIYQFISFTALSMMLFSIVFLGVSLNNKNLFLLDLNSLLNHFVKILFFQVIFAFGIITSILFYLAIILFIVSWSYAWQIFKVNNRNIFDSSFLLFSFIPIVANLLALISQLTSKTDLQIQGDNFNEQEEVAQFKAQIFPGKTK